MGYKTKLSNRRISYSIGYLVVQRVNETLAVCIGAPALDTSQSPEPLISQLWYPHLLPDRRPQHILFRAPMHWCATPPRRSPAPGDLTAFLAWRRAVAGRPCNRRWVTHERLRAGALARRAAGIAAQHRSDGLVSPQQDRR